MRSMLQPEDLTDHEIMAMLMARRCVRDTVLEDYHKAGKITQEEMKALMIEVVNKLFTVLEHPTLMSRAHFPTYWNKPEIDRDFARRLGIE